MGRFETLCGIDVDAQACEDFRRITSAPPMEMDLFAREDYVAFRGHEPPAGWTEATSYDIWRAMEGQTPDVVFLSAPCKGFSGLLPQQCAAGDKYQALNRLAVRGLRLTIEAFEDDLPALILLENVPRIQTRGAALLAEIRAMLTRVGYVYLPQEQCKSQTKVTNFRRRPRLPKDVKRSFVFLDRICVQPYNTNLCRRLPATCQNSHSQSVFSYGAKRLSSRPEKHDGAAQPHNR